MSEHKKVVVGMSGGVDSSVAAYLLKEQGYQVIGVTMQMWQPENMKELQNGSTCCAASAVSDAKRVCDLLEIPHYVLDFQEEFKAKVVDNFVSEYLHARTPNPCVRCNRHIKWEALLARAKELGADYVATGHYARIEQLENKRFALVKSITDKKDQTYALCHLTQEQLAHTIFPLGDYEKEEIRAIAAKINLPVAQKKESMDICFIPDDDYGRFLRDTGVKLPEPGDFVDTDGNVLGRHKGIYHYTIGQRKGLGISAESRLFVQRIDPEKNQVVLSKEDAYGTVLYCNEINHMGVERFEENTVISAKIRYAAKPAECRVSYVSEDMLRCEFLEPVRAITPGQAVAFYDQQRVLGGGIITGV